MKPHRNDCTTCEYFLKDHFKSKSLYGFCTWPADTIVPHWLTSQHVSVYAEDHQGCATWKYGPLPIIKRRTTTAELKQSKLEP